MRHVLTRLWSRRSTLALGTLAGFFASGGLRVIAAQGDSFAPVRAEGIQRIDAGGPTGLLGLDASGALWALSVSGGAPLRMAGSLDGQTPVAAADGRIAARTRDGALWVLDHGNATTSAPGVLAPHAGLLNLPLAVIGVLQDGPAHRLVRMESGARGWQEATRSEAAVLPDARPLRVDLEDRGDGGHLAVFGGPDDSRYRHGVLGDGIEATRLLWLERHGLGVLREYVLPAPYVFEDIAPRPVRFDNRTGLLTVRSGPGGAQLALLASDRNDPARIELRALGEDLGRPRRWMAPTTDGQHLMAVHTPHIGGDLFAYTLESDRLTRRRVGGDVSTHRIGTRELDMAAWVASMLVLPSQNGMRLRVLSAADGWQERASIALPAQVVMTVRLPDEGAMAVLMVGGAVGVVHV
ncbi:hypothetical protein [Variovorax sp. PAMC 28711]|uniref:hypothetical protein n=1 Tax=Variovorax sp. PAMC 28711 TaxID=1795631 RepID=UPI000B055331|nr:hypothetical protein [Variovorax sp. PAMC 28711]